MLDAFKRVKKYYKTMKNSHLFSYIQMFIISGKEETRYFSKSIFDNENSNNIINFNDTAIFENDENERCLDLFNFSKNFLLKNKLLEILTKYCVFNDKKEIIIFKTLSN